ncbi:MAG TPA: BlaI/MecI/CopY family transcriptional regulator [Acidobacteriaceae bacterium]|jgi:predicted transcriptional regulator
MPRFSSPSQQQPSRQGETPSRAASPLLSTGASRLGDREREVLSILWERGSATVQEVSNGLPVRLAYTTVMTTLDRLFKKGLLQRVKHDRAFLYSPAISPNDVESGRALALLQRFFSNAPPSKDAVGNKDMLLSCLVDAIGHYDDAMLHQLEDKVRAARQRLAAEQMPSGEASKSSKQQRSK